MKAIYKRWTQFTPDNLLYDRLLLWLLISLLLFGLIMVTSASIPVGSRLQNDAFYFSKRDGIYLLLSATACYIVVQISMEKWQKYSTTLFFVSLILLALVLVPGIGREVNGAKRWIPVLLFNFQPAELAKLALTCYLAGYFVRKYEEVRNRQASAIKPFVLVAIMGGLLLQQPDLGSVGVLVVITFGLLFIVGAKLWQFFAFLIVVAFLFFVLILSSAYRLKRMTAFLDPFLDPYGTGFQLSNSLMAFGQGQFWGSGLGNSIQKLEYLPEAHTDFIMAVVGEEFGFKGILLVIVLLGFLVFRAMKIGRESLLLEQRFKGFFAFGISFWIFFQGFVNLGMAMGMLPTKGLTFPLVSYGGSSLIIMSIAVAVLLRIDHENRLMQAGQAHLRDD